MDLSTRCPYLLRAASPNIPGENKTRSQIYWVYAVLKGMGHRRQTVVRLQYELIYLKSASEIVRKTTHKFKPGSVWFYIHLPAIVGGSAEYAEDSQIILGDLGVFTEVVKDWLQEYLSIKYNTPIDRVWREYDFHIHQAGHFDDDIMWVLEPSAKAVHRSTRPIGYDYAVWTQTMLFTAIERYRLGLSNSIDTKYTEKLYKWNTAVDYGAPLWELSFFEDLVNHVRNAVYLKSKEMQHHWDNTGQAQRELLKLTLLETTWLEVLREDQTAQADIVKTLDQNPYRLIYNPLYYEKRQRNQSMPLSADRAIAHALNVMMFDKEMK